MGAMKEMHQDVVDSLMGMPIGEVVLWDGQPGEVIRVRRGEDPEGPYWDAEVLNGVDGEVQSTEVYTDTDELLAYVWGASDPGVSQ